MQKNILSIQYLSEEISEKLKIIFVSCHLFSERTKHSQTFLAWAFYYRVRKNSDSIVVSFVFLDILSFQKNFVLEIRRIV